jgi:autotransporter-associated beta strand protein
LTGSGIIRSGWNGAGFLNFTFGLDNVFATIDGVLAHISINPGNFVKMGIGTQVLAGVNTCTGTTTIDAGNLRVNSVFTWAAGPATTIGEKF